MLEIPMHKGEVPCKDTALLVVDMQLGFFDNKYTLGQAGIDVTPLRQAIPGTVRLVRLARAAGVPVIFTRFVYTRGMVDFPRLRKARNAASSFSLFLACRRRHSRRWARRNSARGRSVLVPTSSSSMCATIGSAMRRIPAPIARSNALLTGEIGIDPSVPPSLLGSLAANPAVKVQKSDGFRVTYIGFNVNYQPAMADLNFRLAVDHAIDRETISTRLLGGLSKPVAQLAPPVTLGHDTSISITPFDPEKAKEILAKTSYKGEPIPFEYPNNNHAPADDDAQALAGYLGNIGINIELKPMEFSAFLPAWSQRKLTGMFNFAYGSSSFDSSDITAGMYETNSRIYQVDPEIDRLSKEARATFDESKRKELYSQFFKMSQATAAYAPLYVEVLSFATRANVKWEPKPTDSIASTGCNRRASNRRGEARGPGFVGLFPLKARESRKCPALPYIGDGKEKPAFFARALRRAPTCME